MLMARIEKTCAQKGSTPVNLNKDGELRSRPQSHRPTRPQEISQSRNGLDRMRRTQTFGREGRPH